MLLVIFSVMLGMLGGTVIAVPDASAQREIHFTVLVPKKGASVTCSDIPDGINPTTGQPWTTPNPLAVGSNACSNLVGAPKPGGNSDLYFYSGGCTYYDWGPYDRNRPYWDGNDWKFPPVTFPAGTMVTPAIFMRLPGGNPNGGSVIVEILDDTGTKVAEQQLHIGERMPAGVKVPGPTQMKANTRDIEDPEKGAVPYTGLFNRLVECIHKVIYDTLVSQEMQSYIGPMNRITHLLVILSISMFGIDFLLGKPRARKPFTVISKAALIVGVLAYTQSVGVREYLEFFLRSQEEFTNIVAGSVRITPSGTTANGETGVSSACMQSEKEYTEVFGAAQSPSPRPYGTWERVDCIVASLLGMRLVGSDASRMAPEDIVSAIGSFDFKNTKQAFQTFVFPVIFVGQLFSSNGPWILLLGGGIIVLMIAAFTQAVIVYVISMVVVTFLGIVGPIIIPMALFDSTRPGFLHWVQMMFAFMLQPAILMAFLTFMLFVVDFCLYGRAPLSNVAPTGGGESEVQTFNRLNGIKNRNPAEQAEFQRLEFPREGSLMWFYKQVDEMTRERFTSKPIIDFESHTQDVNREQSPPGNAATAGNEQGAFFTWPTWEWKTGGKDATTAAYNTRMNYLLVRAMLSTILLMGLMFSMMRTVMDSGAQLVGLEASSKMAGINAYHTAAEWINDRMRGK